MGEEKEEVRKKKLAEFLKLLAGKVKEKRKPMMYIETFLYSSVFTFLLLKLKILKIFFYNFLPTLISLLIPIEIPPIAFTAFFFLFMLLIVWNFVSSSYKKEQEELKWRFGNRFGSFLVLSALLATSPMLLNLISPIFTKLIPPEFKQTLSFIMKSPHCILSPTPECFQLEEKSKEEVKVESYDVIKFEIERKNYYTPGIPYVFTVKVKGI